MEKAGQEKRIKKEKFRKHKLSRMGQQNFFRLKLSRKWPKFAKFPKISAPKVHIFFQTWLKLDLFHN